VVFIRALAPARTDRPAPGPVCRLRPPERPGEAASASRLLLGGLLLAGLVGTGCDGDDDPAGAGAPDTGVLHILSREEVGLSFGQSERLRVRLDDARGQPRGGQTVSFSLVTTGDERTGGSSLSALGATTDGDGVAEISLIAGAERVNFRVQARAERAAPATFFVAVSAEGFAHLRVLPVHLGGRAPESFSAVQVRLYRAEQLHCSELDIDAPPVSLSPARTLASFGLAAEYRQIAAGDAYTVIAWAESALGPRPLAVGCLGLGETQVRTGAPVGVALPVVDRPLGPPATALALQSSIDTGALHATLPLRPWRILACPAGPGQLLLDCALDSLASDGALDCLVTGSAPLLDALEPARGAVEPASGCRSNTRNTQPSLEAELTSAVTLGGGFPTGAALANLLGAQNSILDGFELESSLRFLSSSLAVHQLRRALQRVGSATVETRLDDGRRPWSASDTELRQDENGLALGSHAFTFGFGPLARTAFVEHALPPAGLGGQLTTLGSALAGSLRGPGGSAGCTALSQLVCAQADEPETCLYGHCEAARVALDARLLDWLDSLAVTGLDLRLSGTAAGRDDDDDLLLDGLGRELAPGQWVGELSLAGGQQSALRGTFGSSAAAPAN
jgi:hypothetical protein